MHFISWEDVLESAYMMLLLMQARVYGVREQSRRPSDAQYSADVERSARQQVARRGEAHLRCRQGEASRSRPQHEAVLQLGRTRP